MSDLASISQADDTDSLSTHDDATSPFSTFAHLAQGNAAYTERAIAAYLKSKGVPPQSYTAELIMFMERSFNGKYKSGERTHYQRVMPSASWRKGDTLSEKLSRCKDKETFKRRFDRIGTTAILKREHFLNFKISKLDFKGRLYLRLIDTSRDNRSWFYRNDAAVDSFIHDALAFYKDQCAAKRLEKVQPPEARKPEGVTAGNTALLYLENPKPLLTDETVKSSRKTNRTSLTLVHSSPHGKNQNLTPEGIEDRDTSGFGFDDELAAVQCGLISPHSATSHTRRSSSASPKEQSGVETYRKWRIAILAKDPAQWITEKPSQATIGQARQLQQRFNEALPDGSISDFFTRVTDNWIRASRYLKDGGVWQNQGNYPEIPHLLKHANNVLTWYMAEISDQTPKAVRAVKPDKQAVAGQAAQSLGLNTGTPAPLRGCERTNAPGRTFDRGVPKSLEYQIATSVPPSPDDPEIIHQIHHSTQLLLESNAIDLGASLARIEELRSMAPDEIEKHCC